MFHKGFQAVTVGSRKGIDSIEAQPVKVKDQILVFRAVDLIDGQEDLLSGANKVLVYFYLMAFWWNWITDLSLVFRPDLQTYLIFT